MTDFMPGPTVSTLTMKQARELPGPQATNEIEIGELLSNPGIGLAIRLRRERLGFTVAETADMVGIPDDYLARIESGTAYPVPHIGRISLFLGTTIDALRYEARCWEVRDDRRAA